MKRIWLLVCLVLSSAIIPAIAPSAIALAATAYTFTSATQITGGGLTFTGSGNSFVVNQICELSQKTGPDGEVQTTITIGAKITGGAGGYNATIKTTETPGAAGCPAPPTPVGKTQNITVSDPNGVGPGGGNTGTAAGAGTTDTPTLTCNAGFNPLNWLLCAAVKGMVDTANQLDSLINAELAIGTQNVADSNGAPTGIFGPCAAGTTCGATDYKAAWSSFRDIALGLLVVVGLIAVFSTALGMQVFDAYTIRKVLPRLIIIAIAITLSWNLLDFLITFTNDLGYGVRYLIYKPFTGLKLGLSIGGGTGVAVDLIGGAAITAMGIFGLLLFAATAVIAIIAFFFLLIIRQVLVTALIVIAPIALVMYILPNTQRFWGIYWGALSKACLLGVVVEAIVAFGHVGAAIASQNASPVNQLSAFAMYFGAYFIAFSQGPRLAGAGIGAIAGVASRMTQGTRNSISKKQGDNVKEKVAKARAGQRWDENFGRFKVPFMDRRTSIGHLANRGAVNMFDQDELGRYRAGKYGTPGFKKYNTKVNEQLDDAASSQSIKAFQHIQQESPMHYKAYDALTGVGLSTMAGEDANGVAISERLKTYGEEQGIYDAKTQQWTGKRSQAQLEGIAAIMQESSENNVREGGADLEQNAGTLGNIRSSSPDAAYTDLQSIGLLGLASEGRANSAKIAEVGNSISTNATNGAAQRIVSHAQNISSKMPTARKGHGIARYETVDKKGRKTVGFRSAYVDPESDAAFGSVTTLKQGDWAGAKGDAVKEAHDAIKYAATYTAAGDTTHPYRSMEDKLAMEAKAKQMRSMIQIQATAYGQMDPDAKSQWEEMRKGLATDPRYAGEMGAVEHEFSDPTRMQPPQGGPTPTPGAGPSMPTPPTPGQTPFPPS